jgi:hypothetical protein
VIAFSHFALPLSFQVFLLYNKLAKRGDQMKPLLLEKLLKVLKQEQGNQTFNYTVPDLWNCFDYNPDKIIRTNNNELMVDPYDFYASVIEDYILPNKKKEVRYSESLSLGTKAFRTCRPRSVRMGMFCKFGLFELKRPVAATA